MFFPVTKGRDISEFDQVTTVTKVDSVLSVNGWQYPNHLAQFTRLLPYLHCRLNVNLHRIVIITKKTKKRLMQHFSKQSSSVISQTLLEESWSWVYQDDKQQMLQIIEHDLSQILHLTENRFLLILAELWLQMPVFFPHLPRVCLHINVCATKRTSASR